jgi:hypothetical protein
LPHVITKPSQVVELHAKEFSVDLKVQRQLNEKRAHEIAEDLQPHALGLLIASKREDGHTYVLDGQTRISACRIANYDGLLATRLFTGLTLKEEASLFLAHNNSRSVMAVDRFKVRITEEEPMALSINKVLKAYGLHVEWANNESLGIISAIATLEKVYKGAGVRPEGEYPDLLDKVVRTLHRAYGERNDRATYSRVMMEGLGILIATFGSRINYDRLVYVLQGQVPRQIAAQTRSLKDAKGGTLGVCASEVFHKHYNHRYKSKLPEFNEVQPLDNYIPENDPLYVDPAQFVREV